MTLPLNGPSRNDHGALEQRVRQLEQALRQITVRDAGHSENTPVTRDITQAAHGFTVDQVVRIDDGGTTWYLARADDSATTATTTRGDHNTGIVTRVLDVNTFIVTLWGPARLDSVPALPYNLYCVSEATAGAYEDWGAIAPGVNKFRHAVFFHLTDGDVIVLGPEHGHTHSQKLVDLRDVKQGTAPSDGYVPTWVAANSRFEFILPVVAFGDGWTVVTSAGAHHPWQLEYLGTTQLSVDAISGLFTFSAGFNWLTGGMVLQFNGAGTGPSIRDHVADNVLELRKDILVADGGIGTNTATLRVDGVYNCQGSAGFSGNITLAKLTPGGANGSITVLGGIITARTNPT